MKHTLVRSFCVWLVLGLSLSTAYAAPTRQAPDQLLPDQPQTGQLSEENGEEVWTFVGSADDLIVIDMRADLASDLDPYLTLFDPDGVELVYDDDGGMELDARIGPIALATTGTFTVRAGRYSGTGGYTIKLSLMDTLPTLEIGQPVSGVVDAHHPSDFYLLPGVETETLLRLLAPFDSDHTPPVFDVFGPNGLIASSEYEEYPVIDPIILLPGEHYTVAANWDGVSDGPYELRLEPSKIELISLGVPQTGQIVEANYYQQTHYFHGEAGQRVRLTLTTDDELSLACDMTSIDGAVFPFSNSGTAVYSFTAEIGIPNSAVYQIIVYDGSYSYLEGRYTLTIESAGP